MKSLKKKDVFL